MYTNGYTKQPYLSLIKVGDRLLTEAEYAAEAEHIELATWNDGNVYYRHPILPEVTEFSGFASSGEQS